MGLHKKENQAPALGCKVLREMKVSECAIRELRKPAYVRKAGRFQKALKRREWGWGTPVQLISSRRAREC